MKVNLLIIGECLALAGSFFPRDAGDPKSVISAWFKLFEHDDAELFKKAFVAALGELKFMPTPADIRERIRCLTNPEALTSEAEAWNIVRELSRRCETEETAREKLQHLPTVYSALKAVGGITRVQFADYETELPFIRKDFVRYFISARDMATKHRATYPLLEESKRQSIPHEQARRMLDRINDNEDVEH